MAMQMSSIVPTATVPPRSRTRNEDILRNEQVISLTRETDAFSMIFILTPTPNGRVCVSIKNPQCYAMPPITPTSQNAEFELHGSSQAGNYKARVQELPFLGTPCMG
jgi:hypothetical protein